MSNTETLGQAGRRLDLQLEATKVTQKQERHDKEISLYNALVKRVNAGEFPKEDAAREVVKCLFADRASEATRDAIEAFLDTPRDWEALNEAYEQRVKDGRTLEERWAKARIDFWNRLGGSFSRSWSLEDGQLPAEALDLQKEASCWHRDGFISKVSGFVDVAPSGAASYRVVLSNPRRVEGQRDVETRKGKKKEG